MTDTLPTSSSVTPQTRMTPEQLGSWEENGFHVARGLFSRTEVADVASRFDALAERAEGIEGHWEPDLASDDILRHYPRVMQPHDFDPASRDLFLDPRVRAVLQQLLGED